MGVEHQPFSALTHTQREAQTLYPNKHPLSLTERILHVFILTLIFEFSPVFGHSVRAIVEVIFQSFHFHLLSLLLTLIELVYSVLF